MYWIALVALVAAAAFDARTREIPDTVSTVLIVTALLAKLLGFHAASWNGILVGAAAAFAVSAVLFWKGGLGGGDVKLLTALGAALGIGAFLPFVLTTALVGGVVALALRGREDREMAYAPVMLAGLLVLLPVVWLQ